MCPAMSQNLCNRYVPGYEPKSFQSLCTRLLAEILNPIVTAMGWGYKKEDSGIESDYIRISSLDVISNEICQKTDGALIDREFCAFKKRKGTCQVSDIFSFVYQR
ncbi:hypothetical protein DAPPUDRAFT_323409 [Daphnia pulex]|uniref:Peptidase S1 domain-containing protein n=1 Tax=Daphnia pulex TaxID=6669 RepID=E9GYT1_DAPPU|nr:hypothetical protein DAPPUDRAFT_323409 [Daphnia pulex]|eukprot:EFX75216.1 hypothetical protein DAPPUDRAFT_323409 [Daphnia pulex]